MLRAGGSPIYDWRGTQVAVANPYPECWMALQRELGRGPVVISWLEGGAVLPVRWSSCTSGRHLGVSRNCCQSSSMAQAIQVAGNSVHWLTNLIWPRRSAQA